MDPRISARIAANGGLITRREVLACGATDDQIKRLVAADELVVVRRGVYTLARDWESWDEYVERPRQRGRAAHLTTRGEHVLSHDNAAHELGLAILRPRIELVHLTRPFLRAAPTRNGVKHHGASYRAGAVRRVDGVPVLPPARTAVDMAREYGVRGGLPTFDAAMRTGVTRRELWAEIELMRGWPDVAAPRICADIADAGAETVIESLGREFLIELGLGDPETQFPVRIASGRVMWCDIRVGCHVFELEGRIKLTPRDRGGVADKDPDQVRWDQRRRERDVCAEGLGMSFLFWEDFFGEARQRAAARVRREYGATTKRHGTQLPAHLAEFAHRMRGQREARVRARGQWPDEPHRSHGRAATYSPS